MGAHVVLGCQWGDEGKGKFVDVLSANVDCIVRYQGGHNAGHTIVTEQGTFVLHLLPSGVLKAGMISLIGNGVVVHPQAFLKEIDLVEQLGVQHDKIFISNRAQVIMPYHILLDRLQEEARSQSQKIGTTLRGIGPCYTDKYQRTGITIADLINKKSLENKLKTILPQKNALLSKLYGQKELNYDEIFDEYYALGQKIAHRVVDGVSFLNNLLSQGKEVLFEGAQGTMLDVDFGTYPYVTSSNTIAGGLYSNTGLAPQTMGHIIGITKAYTTRVGEGPFISELNDETGALIRARGHEYGATTKRPRRCGWLDLVALKYAVQLNGITDIVLTKLDILGNLDEIKVCTAYQIDGQTLSYMPATLEELSRVTPVYTSFASWNEEISALTSYEELPSTAKTYIESLEELLGTSISLVSVGPNRTETIVRKALFGQ